LEGRMADYPLIIVPDWAYLASDFKSQLQDYAKKGGNLLLVGPEIVRLFTDDLQVAPGETLHQPSLHSAGSEDLTLEGDALLVKAANGVQVYGTLTRAGGSNAPTGPAASVSNLGAGKVAAIYFDLSRAYLKKPSETTRQFLDEMVHQLFPTPMVEVKGSREVDVIVNRKGNALAINLVNTSGPHRSDPIIPSISPVGPLEVAVATPTKPAKVTLWPEKEPLPFEYSSGRVQLTVPQVRIHEILVIE